MRKMNDMNKALLLKLVWGLLVNKGEMWVSMLKAKYNWNDECIQKNFKGRKGSNLWRCIAKIWHLVLPEMTQAIGNERGVNFWKDRWTNLEPRLEEVVDPRIPEGEMMRKVAEYMNQNGEWDWPRIWVTAVMCSQKDQMVDKGCGT